MDPRPMDIDPIDGGPKDIQPPPTNALTASGANSPVAAAASSSLVPMQISEEEDARQAIEMLRGDDVSARVAAANRLESVATVLGEKRTREVSSVQLSMMMLLAGMPIILSLWSIVLPGAVCPGFSLWSSHAIFY